MKFSSINVIKWSEADFESGKVNVKALCENGISKEIQIAMGANSHMKEHKAPFAIFVQVLKGAIEFEVGAQKFQLGELDMISLGANVPHSLSSSQNSIVRLSLGYADSVQRVNAVLD